MININEIDQLEKRLIYLKDMCQAIINLKSEDIDIDVSYEKTYNEYIHTKNKLQTLKSTK